MNEQQHLFDPTTTRERTAGEKSFDEFLDDPAVGYHASFRSDWGLSPSHHFGTLGTAALHLESKGNQMKDSPIARSRYMDPSVSDIPWDGDTYEEDNSPLEGRIHARKLNPAQFRSTDEHANAADAAYRAVQGGEETHEIPRSILDSFTAKQLKRGADVGDYLTDTLDDVAEAEHPSREMTNKTRRAYGAMSRGEAVSYANTVESDPFSNSTAWDFKPNISHVAPRGGQRTWEEDVREDPNASTTKKDFARQREQHGTASTVPVPHLTSKEGYYEPKLPFGGDERSGGKQVQLENVPPRNLSKQFDIPGAS